jgi:hypothetical protein
MGFRFERSAFCGSNSDVVAVPALVANACMTSFCVAGMSPIAQQQSRVCDEAGLSSAWHAQMLLHSCIMLQSSCCFQHIPNQPCCCYTLHAHASAPVFSPCLLLQELQREYPGPVTAVESLRGFLLMAIGNKLEMHYKQVGHMLHHSSSVCWCCSSNLETLVHTLIQQQAGRPLPR